ncbi:MAG: ATP-dependent DNA helicase RecG, partial [Gammaproteobacteria bacterium]|nr:ATP-dependent DNA helicase RecG [Gammaproteobacteria bacterium]
KHRAPVIGDKNSLGNKLLTALPFELTKAQQKVIGEIKNDLARTSPMQRLVQGDVGCGKTLVAVMAALSAVEAGMQTAVMAPTEILSEQHYNNFCSWLQPLGIHITWLTGKQKTAERRKSQEEIATGKAQIVVGTHALFQEEVSFYNLGLFVIDEQHRFGVHQRMALREKGRDGQQYPHQLIMTATPIPRTLAMTAYADLDVSIIDELPPGRQEVETIVIPNDRRDEITARVHHACKAGRQVYWVCSLIEESEALQCQAASDTAVLLQECLQDLKIGLIHGRMKPDDKEQVMLAFKQGEIDLLVATTVIEVGVDVPNASLMVIENSERFGLSQLHQLRGRVGRGSEKSSCVLMYQTPLSENSRTRLAVMRETSDGFKIAQHDLELRGPGEVLGTRQTGIMQFHIADIIRDQALIPEVNKVAETLLMQNPDHAKLIMRRWLGETEQYGNVG